MRFQILSQNVAKSSKYHFSGSCNDQGVGVYLLHLDSDSS